VVAIVFTEVISLTVVMLVTSDIEIVSKMIVDAVG
jgi:hypothetical protein